jgi:hypothetical protein
MWALLIIFAGAPMPHPITWHTTHDRCEAQAGAELLHAATNRRQVLHVECRSYVVPPTRPLRRAEVLR